jgi:hypothetical protein
LCWWQEAGSIGFKGCLPLVEGEAFTTLIRAYSAQARHLDAQADGRGVDEVTPGQRHADALIHLVADANRGHSAPSLAGDRPTIMVTLDYQKLHDQAAQAARLPSGQPISAGDLRRLCCDANLIPAVLGGASQPLDVGRTQRFVTGPIRKALTLRDRHCCFPQCDRPAAECDAHHLRPWWDHGLTSLNNLVLLCPQHHALIEPDPHATRDQWRVHIHTDGYPIFHPPHPHPQPGPIRHADAPPIPAVTQTLTNPAPNQAGQDDVTNNTS